MDLFVKPEDQMSCMVDAYEKSVRAAVEDKIFVMKNHVHPYERIVTWALAERRKDLEDYAFQSIGPLFTPGWVYAEWSGPMVLIPLLPSETFADFEKYQVAFSAITKKLIEDGHGDTRPHAPHVYEPEHQDFPEQVRRSWTYQVGSARATLALLGEHSRSCQLEKTGTQDIYKINCGGNNG